MLLFNKFLIFIEILNLKIVFFIKSLKLVIFVKKVITYVLFYKFMIKLKTIKWPKF